MLTAFTRLGVTKRENRALEILMKREIVSYETLEAAVYGDRPPGWPRVALSGVVRNLRAKISIVGTDINNIHDVGYSIPLEGRRKLKDFLSEETLADGPNI
jgi:DNA-binding response OmpR family regulator